MRGRTLDDAYIILDEAQNTTPQQMKMFLTRMGQGSRAVITGDITQIDVPAGQTSGLIEAERRPVSYTHLDVYKRQVIIYRWLQKISFFASCYLLHGGRDSSE